ncbi:MAG: T9SS type A sorting domain-containing protein [Muribaculaceae bacterium]|nr:T9SS type A sorting domain-containing protein [Muribaculaceae bacterium]
MAGIDTAGLESGLYVITIKNGTQSRSARIIVL